MLVVTRSPGQSLVIDERIVVTVLAASRGSVRVGIAAPAEVLVRRAELTRSRDEGVDHAGPDDGSAVPHAG
jgi:carbon storage regulator CsrA